MQSSRSRVLWLLLLLTRQESACGIALRRPLAALGEKALGKIRRLRGLPAEAVAKPAGSRRYRAALRSREARARSLLNLPLDSTNEMPICADRDVMISYLLAEEINTAALVAALPGRAVLVGDVAAVGIPEREIDVTNDADAVSSEDVGPPIAFIFPYGVAVLWGFDRAESDLLLSTAVEHALGVVAEPKTSIEDRMVFRALTEVERSKNAEASSSSLTSSSDDGDDDDTGLSKPIAPRPSVSIARADSGRFALSDVRDSLIKLSVSYAFAQSARVTTVEEAVEDLIDDVSPITEALAATGQCKSLSIKNVGKLDGRAFALSSTLNLYSDILDVPDFFWDNDDYRPIYELTAQYLDISKRARVLNARLDVVQRLLENLSSRLDHSKATRLEWIVIILIVLEVVHVYDPFLRKCAALSLKNLRPMLL